jgi:hypothetical protein
MSSQGNQPSGLGGGPPSGDGKDDKSKKVRRTAALDLRRGYHLNSSLVLMLPLAEGEAQVRTTSPTNDSNRSSQEEGSWSKCISKAPNHLPYISMQVTIPPDAAHP